MLDFPQTKWFAYIYDENRPNNAKPTPNKIQQYAYK